MAPPPKNERNSSPSSAYANYIKQLEERRYVDEQELHETKKKQFSNIMGIDMNKLNEAIPGGRQNYL